MADAVNLALENSVEEAEQLLKCSTFSTREVQMSGALGSSTCFEGAGPRESIHERYSVRDGSAQAAHPAQGTTRRRIDRSSRSDAFFLFRRSDLNERLLRASSQRARAGGSSALANAVGHAFIRKVHVLYQRVLRKYPGNVGLWLDFATFCFSHGNARLLSEVMSQGLRLNPSCAGLWCFAANWEYKHKGDISAARRLLTARAAELRAEQGAVAGILPPRAQGGRGRARQERGAGPARRRRGRQPGRRGGGTSSRWRAARTRATACSTRSS